MPAPEKLPPGSSGLPLLGETLPFISDMFGFIRGRTERYGPVFRSSILGHPTAFISGPEVTDQWLDESKIQRADSFPAPVRQLVGGPGILPLMDGAEHRQRKELLMAAFTREALATYLPALQQIIESALGRWATGVQRPLLPELKLVAVEGICANVLGMKAGPELDRLVSDYGVLFKGFTGLPLNLPGFSFRAALQARDRILSQLAAEVQRHQAGKFEDGLSRVLAARTAAGKRIAPGDATKEMHHVVLAGVIVFAELGAMLLELSRHPAVRETLVAEVKAVAPGGPVTPDQLRQMPYLDQVVMEVKRTCPNVPVSFGRSRVPIHIGGTTIPAGWNVMMAIGEHNRNAIFTRPEEFDPDRFGESRAEQRRHPHAFAPQGAGSLLGGHKCAGYDYSTVFMQLFTVLLARGYTWEVPPQDLSVNRALVPPELKSGLRVVIRKR
ncbi:MAG TPA: cytochrome P450 [Myxococcaceae bacterium]|nr:cytochrome P450 [Myxococcaceae bacterium]